MLLDLALSFMKASHEELQEDAKKLLQLYVDQNDLPSAWKVFVELEALLPRDRSIPAQEDYPLFTADIKGNDWYYDSRGKTYLFTNIYDEDSYLVLKATPEELVEYEVTPERIEQLKATMWEILRNGSVGFDYDW